MPEDRAVLPAPPLKRELGLRDLTLFAVAFIVGPRWIAIAAHAGPGSVTLWIAAAVLFAAPLGVAVAALMAKYPEAGGLYVWTREDFGPWHGFLAFWTYWFAIALTLPTSAMFSMSMSAYTFGPSYAHLADSAVFVVCASLASIWIALAANILGMNVGKWVENAGGLTAGILGALLIGVAALAWTRGGSATPLDLRPAWNWATLGFFGAIAYGLSGMEVLGMMGAEIRSPSRTVVPAAWIGTAFSAAFYAATTVALLILIRPESIQPLHGLADGGEVATRMFGWWWLTPVIAATVLVNQIGGCGAMGASVSRLPYAAGVDALLPAAFGKVHPRWGTPHFSILIFGGVTSLLLLAIQAGETLRAAYQELVSLMVIAGFLPYLYLFGSAWKCGRKLAAILGLATTALAIASSVVPTPDIGNVWLFEGKLAAGTISMIGSAWVVYRRSSGRQAVLFRNR
jgi:amino acid transporter